MFAYVYIILGTIWGHCFGWSVGLAKDFLPLMDSFMFCQYLLCCCCWCIKRIHKKLNYEKRCFRWRTLKRQREREKREIVWVKSTNDKMQYSFIGCVEKTAYLVRIKKCSENKTDLWHTVRLRHHWPLVLQAPIRYCTLILPWKEFVVIRFHIICQMLKKARFEWIKKLWYTEKNTA